MPAGILGQIMNIQAFTLGIHGEMLLNCTVTLVLATAALVVPASPIALFINSVLGLPSSFLGQIRSIKGSIGEEGHAERAI